MQRDISFKGFARRIQAAFTLLAITVLLTACDTLRVAPGHDPLLVNAERLASSAFHTVDTFPRIEYENRFELIQIEPEIHVVAEDLRENFPPAIRHLRLATEEYKRRKKAGTMNNSAPADLQIAIDVITAMVDAAAEQSTKPAFLSLSE